MVKKQLFVGLSAVLMLSACAPKHYQLTGVNRTRIIVDSRYDQNPDEAAAKFIAPFKRVNDSIMAPIMGQVAHNMHPQRPESDLSNLVSDILVWAAKDYNEQPVLGVYNMGGIRADLVKGNVTYEDVLSIAPFENKICFVTLTGEQLMRLFEQIAGRGGEGVSKGAELVITKDNKLVSARLHGQEIDPQAKYRVTTINYLLEGNDGLTAFISGSDKVAPDDPSNNSRYLIMNYFRDKQARGEVVDAQVEGRIKIQ
ncbi:MAG: 5'-nucleotidase C-terminal domain-containing protein [Prevotella sp.]|nr:5'-nucleotidase C-terminal domain-containing protein [Prevotella sp.]